VAWHLTVDFVLISLELCPTRLWTYNTTQIYLSRPLPRLIFQRPSIVHYAELIIIHWSWSFAIPIPKNLGLIPVSHQAFHLDSRFTCMRFFLYIVFPCEGRTMDFGIQTHFQNCWGVFFLFSILLLRRPISQPMKVLKQVHYDWNKGREKAHNHFFHKCVSRDFKYLSHGQERFLSSKLCSRSISALISIQAKTT